MSVEAQRIADEKAGLVNGINSVTNLNYEVSKIKEKYETPKEIKSFKSLSEFTTEDFQAKVQSKEFNAAKICTYFSADEIASNDVEDGIKVIICELLRTPARFYKASPKHQKVIKDLMLRFGIVSKLNPAELTSIFTAEDIRNMSDVLQKEIYNKITAGVFLDIPTDKGVDYLNLLNEIQNKFKIPKSKIDFDLIAKGFSDTKRMSKEFVYTFYNVDKIRQMDEKIQLDFANKFDQESLKNYPEDFQSLINEIKARNTPRSTQTVNKTPIENQPVQTNDQEYNPENFKLLDLTPESTKPPTKKLPTPVIQKQLPQNAQQDQDILASNKDQKIVLATLNNLIKIARDLDKEGKFVESEEVHKTIKKYMQ